MYITCFRALFHPPTHPDREIVAVNATCHESANKQGSHQTCTLPPPSRSKDACFSNAFPLLADSPDGPRRAYFIWQEISGAWVWCGFFMHFSLEGLSMVECTFICWHGSLSGARVLGVNSAPPPHFPAFLVSHALFSHKRIFSSFGVTVSIRQGRRKYSLDTELSCPPLCQKDSYFRSFSDISIVTIYFRRHGFFSNQHHTFLISKQGTVHDERKPTCRTSRLSLSREMAP